MDVLKWKVCAKSSYGFEGRPGIFLALELRCRTCEEEIVAWEAVDFHPSNVEHTDKVRVGKPHSKDSWNKWLIEHRLGESRYCPECGTPSKIPFKQRPELINATDNEVTLVWLQTVAEEMHLTVRHRLVADARYEEDRVYEQFYVAPADTVREISLEWHPFEFPVPIV